MTVRGLFPHTMTVNSVTTSEAAADHSPSEAIVEVIADVPCRITSLLSREIEKLGAIRRTSTHRVYCAEDVSMLDTYRLTINSVIYLVVFIYIPKGKRNSSHMEIDVRTEITG